MFYKYISSSCGQESTCIAKRTSQTMKHGQDVNIQMRSGTRCSR